MKMSRMFTLILVMAFVFFYLQSQVEYTGPEPEFIDEQLEVQLNYYNTIGISFRIQNNSIQYKKCYNSKDLTGLLLAFILTMGY